MRILVAYASADGSTAEVAEHLAARLATRGHDVTTLPVSRVGDLAAFDAVVVGSAIHSRQWLDEASLFVSRHRNALRQRPLYTFSVGMPDALPRFARKLGRTEETAIIANLGGLRPVDHHLFSGVVKPAQFPLASRVFLRLAGGHYGITATSASGRPSTAGPMK
jgi:menaquinone-dependent protoporphyrinogen oxidase